MLAREVGKIEACCDPERLLHRIPPATDLDKVIPDFGRLHASDQAGDVRAMQLKYATRYLHAYRSVSCV